MIILRPSADSNNVYDLAIDFAYSGFKVRSPVSTFASAISTSGFSLILLASEWKKYSENYRSSNDLRFLLTVSSNGDTTTRWVKFLKIKITKYWGLRKLRRIKMKVIKMKDAQN